MLTFIFGRVSTTVIMIIDKALKLVLSCILVSAIAYLFLKQSETSIPEDGTQPTSDSMGDLIKLIDTLSAGNSQNHEEKKSLTVHAHH
jgi:hypothetical protein